MLAVRNHAKGERVAQEFYTAYPNAKIHIYNCDLFHQQDIFRFIEEFKKSNSKLDILINNAGNFSTSHINTADGLESHLAVHVLAPYLLIKGLSPIMPASSRIINMSSSAVLAVRMSSKEDLVSMLTPRTGFCLFAGYCNAKFLQTLLTVHFSETIPNITVNAVHPGMVLTNIATHDPWANMIVNKILVRFFPFLLRSTDSAAQTTIAMALSDEFARVNGAFYHDFQSEPMTESLIKAIRSRDAQIVSLFCEQVAAK